MKRKGIPIVTDSDLAKRVSTAQCPVGPKDSNSLLSKRTTDPGVYLVSQSLQACLDGLPEELIAEICRHF